MVVGGGDTQRRAPTQKENAMSIEWKPMDDSYAYRGFFGEGVCAELNVGKLEVVSCDTEEEGLHVVWIVIGHDNLLLAEGIVHCTFKQIQQAATPILALQPAYELAKKRAEGVAVHLGLLK